MSDQQKHDQGGQQQDNWKKNPNQQQGGQDQGGQKNPQWERDKMDKDQQKKSA
jgi:hypothetical protein